MREIKFRAWHSGANNSLGKNIFPPQMLYDKWNGECFRFAEEGQPVEIMQYTGLTDKNDQDIYEGDIISFLYNRKITILPVAWGVDGWWAKGRGWYKSLYAVKNTAEVIGNIYENANLLEATNAAN